MVVEFLIDSGFTPENKANAISVLNRFGRWLAANHGVTDLCDATRLHCHEYLESRRGQISERTGKPISETTRKGDWRQLRAFYAWAEREREIDGRSPMARIPAPRVPVNPPTKSAKSDGYEAMLATFSTRTELGRRNAAMISLMFRSGVRRGEVPQIDLAHYDQQAQMMTIPHPKNDHSRRVPVHSETASLLRRYLRRRGLAAGPLFRGVHTADPFGRIKPRAVADIVTRANERAGTNLSPHQFRRGFVGEWLRSDASPASLQIVGGWRDPRMVRTYMGEAAEDIAAAEFRAKYDPAGRRPRRRAG